MKTDSDNKESTSGTTSQKSPIAPTESEFLAQQAQQAKDALSQMLSQISGDLKGMVDVRLLTKDHPWTAAAGAAAVGFLAATVLVPSKEQQMAKRLRELERTWIRQNTPSVDGKTAKSDADESMLSKAAKNLFKALQPALVSSITAAVTGHQMKQATVEAHQQGQASAQAAPQPNPAYGPPDIGAPDLGAPTGT